MDLFLKTVSRQRLWVMKGSILLQIITVILMSVILSTGILSKFPTNYKFAFVIAICFSSLLMIVKSPKRVLLFSLALVLPLGIGKEIIATDPSLRLPVSSVSLTLTDAVVIGLLGGLIVRQAVEHEFKIRFFMPITLPALVWLSAGSLSLVNAIDLQVAMVGLVMLTKAIILYLVVANCLENGRDARWLFGGMLIAFAFEALLGIFQGVTGHYAGLSFLGEGSQVMKYSLGDNIANRCEGTVCHPNGLAMYLNTCLPFFLALMFTAVKVIYKLLAALLIGIGIFSLMLTLSRGGWFGFVSSCILVFVLAVLRRRLTIVKAVLFFCIGIIFITFLFTTGPNLITRRLTSSDKGSALSRLTMAQGALALIHDYPIVGAGFNNYTLYMPQYDPVTLAEEHGRFVVHSTFLLITSETGILGLIGFTWFLVSVILQAWRLIKTAPNDLFWITGAGIFCAYIALSVHSMADFALIGCPRVFIQVWVLAGIIMGIGRVSMQCLKSTTIQAETPHVLPLDEQ